MVSQSSFTAVVKINWDNVCKSTLKTESSGTSAPWAFDALRWGLGSRKKRAGRETWKKVYVLPKWALHSVLKQPLHDLTSSVLQRCWSRTLTSEEQEVLDSWSYLSWNCLLESPVRYILSPPSSWNLISIKPAQSKPHPVASVGNFSQDPFAHRYCPTTVSTCCPLCGVTAASHQ